MTPFPKLGAALLVVGNVIACSSDSTSPVGNGDASAGDASSHGGTPPAGAGGAAGSVGAGGAPQAGAAGMRSTGGSGAGTGGRGAGGAGPTRDAGPSGTTDGASDSGAPGYPDETTTGPNLAACAGGALKKYSGTSDYRPKTNEVVSCTEFDSVGIYVPSDVSKVTIENCRFVTTRDLFLNVQGASVTIQDCEFHGPAGTWIRNSYSGNHLTVRRSEFTGMGNAVEFNVGDEVLEDNYVHDFATVEADQHADGLQTDGTSRAVIRHNTVLLNDVAGATGAISIFEGNDILVANNKVAGGGYTVYPGGANSTNVRFIDNCFSTMFYPGKAQSGAYGPWYPSNNPKDLLRTGNTWCDGPRSGQPLNDNP